MTTNKPTDSYDEIKGMLNKVRKIQFMAKPNLYGLIKEQTEDPTGGQSSFEGTSTNQNPPTQLTPPKQQEGQDLAVINNVEVEIHSEDPEDLQLSDEEKNKVSQLIDDFRTDVSELVEFDKLDIYEDSAKLNGNITDIGLGFTLSTGNDTGLYISNASMLKIDDSSLGMITKLKGFEGKFSGAINDLLVNRRTT